MSRAVLAWLCFGGGGSLDWVDATPTTVERKTCKELLEEGVRCPCSLHLQHGSTMDVGYVDAWNETLSTYSGFFMNCCETSVLKWYPDQRCHDGCVCPHGIPNAWTCKMNGTIHCATCTEGLNRHHDEESHRCVCDDNFHSIGGKCVPQESRSLDAQGSTQSGPRAVAPSIRLRSVEGLFISEGHWAGVVCASLLSLLMLMVAGRRLRSGPAHSDRALLATEA